MTQPANNKPDDAAMDVGGFAEAKNKCSHVSIHNCCAPRTTAPENERAQALATILTEPTCSIPDCNQTECWFCLSCHTLFCGRYANNHMSIHREQSDDQSHCIAMGVGDLSFWCYECDSYINHLTIQNVFEVYKIAHIAKHGEPIPVRLLNETRFGTTPDTQDSDELMSGYDDNVDYLDHSAQDTRHSQLMKQIEEDHKSCIEWDETSNTPNIEPILSNLNHRELFVGRIAESNGDSLNNPWQFSSSRTALSGYSLFAEIDTKLKLEYVKLCIDKNEYLSRAIGSMLGMGIGDATGAPLEFIPCVDEYKQSYFTLKGANKWMNEQNAFSLKRGQWTDDASMGLCMADSLILHKKYNGSDIRIRFWNWWNNGYNNAFRLDKEKGCKSSVGLGGNISKSIFSMRDNETPTAQYVSASNKDDSGNGSIMRLAPIPVFFCHCRQSPKMIDIAMEFTKQSSFTTHPGYIAAECCALMSYVMIHAIHRQNEEKDLRVFLERITNEYLKRIEIQHSKLKEGKQELIESKQFKDVQRKVEAESNAWRNIEYKLQHLDRQIIAQAYVMRLIKSEEADDSTERCWNWKTQYGDLGIDKTMTNRGSNYNGYPTRKA
eukprot:182037_1